MARASTTPTHGSRVRAANARRTRATDDRGFTLIELLVVVLIIGILAAIAIPVFLGEQASAKDVKMKSDMVNIRIAALSYRTVNGTFTGAGTNALIAYGFATSGTDPRIYRAANMDDFCADAVGADGVWRVTETLMPTRGSCIDNAYRIPVTPAGG